MIRRRTDLAAGAVLAGLVALTAAYAALRWRTTGTRRMQQLSSP